MAVASLILGILSLVLVWVPFVNLACGVLAIILGVLARKKQPEKKGMAVAGLVMGIIGTASAAIYLACVGTAFSLFARNVGGLEGLMEEALESVQ